MRPDDCRHEGAAEQFLAMLRTISVTRFNLATHDWGTVQADFIAANDPNAVLRYRRGKQQLCHPDLEMAP